MGFNKFFSQFSSPVPDENCCVDTPVDYFPETTPFVDDSFTSIDNEPFSIGTGLFDSDSMFDSSDTDFAESLSSFPSSGDSDSVGTDW